MPIIKWTPFEPLGEDWDKWLEEFKMPTDVGFVPAIDLFEEKGNLIARTQLVGVDSKDVKVEVENNILTIKGETKKEKEVEDKNYYRKEMRTGHFHRSVALPKQVKQDQIKADFENGMLTVTMPVIAEPKAKKSTVMVQARKSVKKKVSAKKTKK